MLNLDADRHRHDAQTRVRALQLLPTQVDNREVVVEVTDVKQTVYIYGCQGSTIQVRRHLSGGTSCNLKPIPQHQAN